MYFITAINSEEFFQQTIKNYSRCFGYFEKLEVAEKAIEENWGDMHEYLYDYLILEEIHPGIHGHCETIQWYKWMDRRWQKSESIMGIKGITNWAIG